MTARIAEFNDIDDAAIFQRAKGDHYTVCGGINYRYAVRAKEHRELCEDVFCEECADLRYYAPIAGITAGVEPPDYRPVSRTDYDSEPEIQE